MNHFGTFFRVSFNHFLQKLNKIFPFLLLQFYHHSYIQKRYFYIVVHLKLFSQQCFFFSSMLIWQFLKDLWCKHHSHHVIPNPVFHPSPVILNKLQKGILVVFEIYEYITTVTVSMNKVVLDKHLEECRSSNPSYKFILLMVIIFVIWNRFSFNIRHD